MVYLGNATAYMDMTVKFPVSPPVYRYCLAQYGTASVKVSHTAPAIYSAFQLLHHPEHYIDFRTGIIDSKYFLELIIPSELRKSNKFFLSDNHVRVFNNMIEGMLVEQLFQYLDLVTNAGMEIKDGIVNFKANIGLMEEEWQYETLKKKYYRHRKTREGTIKSFGKLSPKKPFK